MRFCNNKGVPSHSTAPPHTRVHVVAAVNGQEVANAIHAPQRCIVVHEYWQQPNCRGAGPAQQLSTTARAAIMTREPRSGSMRVWNRLVLAALEVPMCHHHSSITRPTPCPPRLVIHTLRHTTVQSRPGLRTRVWIRGNHMGGRLQSLNTAGSPPSLILSHIHQCSRK